MAVFPLSNKCFCSSEDAALRQQRQLIWMLPRSMKCGPERAAVALSVGLSWPPHKRRPSAGRPSWVLRMVSAYSGRPGGNQETPSAARSVTRRLPTSALQPRWPPRPPPVTALGEDESSDSAAKRRKIHADPIMRDWFLDVMDQWEDAMVMEHAAVIVQSLVPVPQDVRRNQPEHSLALETQRTSGSIMVW